MILCPPSQQEYFDEVEVAPLRGLERRRWQRVDRVLSYAYDHLPFYRERFQQAGFRPQPIRCPEEFAARVPIIRKHDLIQAIKGSGRAEIGIEATGRRRLTNIVMTSGSLGFNTFAFLTAADLSGASLRLALRELWAVKVRPGMRVLTLSPAWHVLALLDVAALSRMGVVAISPWGTFAARFVPTFVDVVLKFQPEHLLVTAPILRWMLAECERRGQRPQDVFRSVRYVACAGEPLSPSFRQKVQEEMGLEDFYERGGSSDGMFGGGECFAHRGHHISADIHYIEVIDPKTGQLLPPGRRGTAVVTNLTLGRSVYIRFDTEDVAEIKEGDCPCGRTHPVLELYGRLADSVTVQGKLITPYDVRCGIDDQPQLQATTFTLGLLPDGEGLQVTLRGLHKVGKAVIAAVEAALRRQLGVEVRVAVGEAQATGWKGQLLGSRRLQP